MASSRLRLGLTTRVFLIAALVILLTLGIAVAATAYLANDIAHRTIVDALRSSYSGLQTFQERRHEQLQLISRIFVADPYLTAYVAEAAANLDRRSILDQLAERQSDLGFDFAIVLDPRGRVLARTDRPDAVGEDLARWPLVARALEEYEAAGVWRQGKSLYQAVAVPLASGLDLIGFLVTGFAVDDLSALEVSRVSRTEVAFLAAGEGGVEVVASTLKPDVASRLLASLRAESELLPRVVERGERVDEVEVALDGEPWICLLAPLLDAGGAPVGVTVALASLDRELAPFRRIQTLLAISGALVAIPAFLLAFAFARRTVRPMRRLVAAAQAAQGGDYDQEIPVEGHDEVADLARAFRGLLRDLRERRDMEIYLREISQGLPEISYVTASVPSPRSDRVEATLMGVELRHHAQVRPDSEPRETLARLSEELGRVAGAVTGQGGFVEPPAGHRVWAWFEGPERSQRALAAATWILGEYRPGDEAGPSLVLTSGLVVVGSVSWREGVGTALVGLPVQQLESLAREVGPGEIAISHKVYEEIEDLFQDAGYELEERRGVFTSQTFYLVNPALAGRVTGSFIPAESERTEAKLVELPPQTGAVTLSRVAPGALLGNRFEVLSVLGAGGMAVVYKAHDRQLNEVVALKMLKPEQWTDQRRIERLKEELKLARRITHPNVLRTYDLGEIDGVPFISMEHVHGITLRSLLGQTDGVPYSAGLRLARQLCQGLAAAHGVGIIHRDIKPENLILDPAGTLKLMDFGIARPVRRLAQGLTEEGALIGTPQYLAPEQIEGKEVDQRADIYACGMVFYEIFTRRRPFPAGRNPMDAILKKLNEPPTPPSAHWPAIPLPLEEVILTCLARDPAERYPNVTVLLGALEELSA